MDYISHIYNKDLSMIPVKISKYSEINEAKCRNTLLLPHFLKSYISRIPVYIYLALIKTSIYIIIQYILKDIVC